MSIAFQEKETLCNVLWNGGNDSNQIECQSLVTLLFLIVGGGGLVHCGRGKGKLFSFKKQ